MQATKHITQSPTHAPSSETIPVIEEQAKVITKTELKGAMRVRIETDVAEEPVTLEHLERVYEAQRVPRGISVASAQGPWTEGDVLVVPVYEEVEVIERRLVLKEEIHLVPRLHRSTRETHIPLHKDRVVVERQQPDGSWYEVEAESSLAPQNDSESL